MDRVQVGGRPVPPRVLPWLMLLAALASLGAQEPTLKTLFTAAEQQAKTLQEAGQFDQALGICEQFLRRCPGTEPYTRIMVVRANHVLNALRAAAPANLPRVQAHYERIHRDFAAVPQYYALATAALARGLLTDPDKAKRDPAQAEALCTEAIERGGESLPRDYYLGYNLYLLRAQALAAQGKLDEAAAELTAAAERSPWMLSDKGYLRTLCQLVRAREPERWLSAAKSYFVLCDFREDPIKEAMDTVGLALREGDDPTAGIRFVQAQEKPGRDNPLRGVELYPVGSREALLASAGEDPAAQINVHLAFGEVDEALALAQHQLQAWNGLDNDDLTAALRSIARCFRAHDLNLLRANAFLSFHTQGEGENPLPALEAELAGEGVVAAQPGEAKP